MKKITQILPAFIVALILYSCGGDGLGKYEFVELDSQDTTEFYTETDTTLELFGIGKGPTWKMWKDLHKGCMKNQWLKRSRYFGVANTLKLGTITDKKFKEVYNTLDDILTKDELDYVIDEGAAQPCEYIRKVSFDLESELNMSISGQNQELGLFLESKKNTNVQINGWQQQNLITDRLIQVLEADSAKENSNKQLYSKRLKEKNNRLLSTVVKINGFTSEIESIKKISPELKLKLDSGLVSGVIGNTGIDVSFTYVDSLTIKTTTNTSFYVFGRYLKTKKQ